MATEGFRQQLQQELLKRIEKNPRYSLRAFATMLGTDPSSLSQMLRGKRACSAELESKLCHKLGWRPDQFTEDKNSGAVTETNYRNLTIDAFNVIADWYHFAIMQLILTKGFKNDPSWIAHRLGITRNEVNVALERLIALEIVEVDLKTKKLICREENISTLSTPYSAAALRKMQKQILEKALTALDEIPIELRDQSSMSFPMNPSRIPEAKKLMKDFRRKLSSMMETDANATEVYQLGMSFYPLTKTLTKEKK